MDICLSAIFFFFFAHVHMPFPQLSPHKTHAYCHLAIQRRFILSIRSNRCTSAATPAAILLVFACSVRFGWGLNFPKRKIEKKCEEKRKKGNEKMVIQLHDMFKSSTMYRTAARARRRERRRRERERARSENCVFDDNEH